MKGERKTYEPINQLPSSAMSVRKYAEQVGFTVSYIYKQFNEKKSKYKIVDFQGYNFVVF